MFADADAYVDEQDSAAGDRPRPPETWRQPTEPAEHSLASLRDLLAARFPAATRPLGRVLPTGVAAIDATAGGIAVGGVTEIVCAAPSSGGQLAVAQILAATRAERKRVALVEAGDAFDPASYEADHLRHVVWVRANGAHEALAAADLLVGDANLALVLLDLRDAAAADLRRVPAPTWFRFQRAVESGELALLVFTPHALVVSAQLRLVIEQPLGDNALDCTRAELVARLTPAVHRQRAHAGQRVG